MRQDSIKNYEIEFDEPRMGMTVVGRLTVRVLRYIVYLVLTAATATFIVSDLKWLRLLGIFFVLFLIDGVLHAGEADIPISELPSSGKINLARVVRPRTYSVLERAFDKSIFTRKNFFLEVAAELLTLKEIEGSFRRLDIVPAELRQKIDEFLKGSVASADSYSKEACRANMEILVRQAFRAALDGGHNFIDPSDLFSALSFVNDDYIGRLFNLFSIEAGDLERALIFSLAGKRSSIFSRIPVSLGGFVLESNRRLRHRIMNRAWTSRPTPTLDKYSVDFTDLARQEQTGFMIGHKEEFDRLVDTLARPINPNVLLVGEAGIGRETLVAHLAFRLAKDDVPESLFDKRLVSLEINNLVAGAAPEELNARLQKIVDEIIMAGNVILYVPDIHNLLKTSGTAYLSAADALMPIITSNAFPIVGATYTKEFKQFIEPRSDFAGAFETIRVNEISEADAEKILIYESIILERRTKILISFGAIKKAVILAKKYFRTKFLPSSAEELLKSALVEAQRMGEKELKPETVIRAAEEKVNIPLHEATAAETATLLDMENIIHEGLVGQNEAVTAVSNALREYRSGLARGNGPIASFLFVGPTGVGKTELAKILAKIQFGSEKQMVRFDMTEYQDKQSFYRFIGSPDGQMSGLLTDSILQRPYSLVLLDEFEKAFPDILNLFLQVFDDGRLTDNLGRTADFQNTIIIATSNAHSDIINDALSHGQSMADIGEYLKKKLIDVFKPELLNRFSRIVVFKNLEMADLGKIVLLNLNDLARTAAEHGIKLEFDQPAIDKIAKLGYDPAFGARPLRRVIEDRLRAPLAQEILKKEVARGSRMRLVLNGEEFSFVDADANESAKA